MHSTPTLAVVVPTFNERGNIDALIGGLNEALRHPRWELIFVDDDSSDGTPQHVEALASEQPNIRLIRRIGRRGLSSACIEGILSTTTPYVAVMDADLQHDETRLPLMLEELTARQLDVVVGTRNSGGGSMGDFSSARVRLSGAGRKLSRLVTRCDLTDPMSGFFLVDRRFFLACVHRMQGGGFKVLLDMLASSPRPVRYAEVGYRFRMRKHGASKLDLNVGTEFLFFLVHKLTRGIIPARFALFAMVGSTGVVTHLLCLFLLVTCAHVSFVVAQGVSTAVAMTENFFLNNLVTFRDLRLRGAALLLGLLSFWLACAFGAWANLLVARSLFQSGWPWFAAGLAGIVISSIWNYAMSSLFTWRKGRRAPAGLDTAPTI